MIAAATRERIVLAARALDGVPYVWGGNRLADVGGLDCSGYVQWVLHVAGCEPWASAFLRPDFTADMLWKRCAPIGEDEHALPGDLAFYGRDGMANHVVIVETITVGGAEVTVIGSSRGDSKCLTVADALVRGARVLSGRPAMYRRDLLGYRRPRLHEAPA